MALATGRGAVSLAGEGPALDGHALAPSGSRGRVATLTGLQLSMPGDQQGRPGRTGGCWLCALAFAEEPTFLLLDLHISTL